ncbi:hypothetical protein M433DRAFT_434786 [Acidomyces richmondensis BFW]|nr:MAG: hypothetical protein FE78DRAFT_238826 [Acidomyces sp. 'richmondensis']KYG48238.1 hypothetical protein M433DRAFT_434786 [Acidomyces richmondensis BFW]
MARLQNPWLGSFIASELDALIKWNESTKKSPQVKSDPDCRFFDDGSNFRCIVGSPPLPADSKVQLLEVISPARDAAVVLLCDGAYSIKATLSEEALANLEEELGEQLSMDVKGDVFLVHSATLISTPYGPEDGHIQLYIDKLQYQYNLRRTPNGLPLVKQHDDVRKLFCQISQIRYQQYAEADNVDCIDSGSPLLDTDMKVTDNLREADCTPVPGLLPSSWLLPDNSQAAVATQIDPSRKRRKMAPSLAKDGFAFETGVNLALPSGTLSSITRQDDMCNALPNLRRLLQNNKCASPSYSRDPNTTTDNIDQRDSGNNQEGRRSSPFISRSSPETPEYLALPHSSLLKTSDRKDMSNFRLQYGRRKPPMSQQRLLNQESSWFPPEAGKQFPVPNVPIELLKIWISEAPIPVSEASRAELSQVGAQPNSTGYEPIVHTGNSDSSSQTSSSEELPWSPSQRKDDYLPPDSTVNSGPRRPEFELQEQRRPSVQSPYRHEQSPNKRDVQHPQLLELQEQFNKSPVRSSTVFSSNSKACPKTKACDSASQMASIARISKVSTISETPIDGSRRSYRESVRTDFPFRSHSTQHHTSTKQFNTNKEMGIGIEGPQISRNDDEMEMDVPRVYRDPARVHRQKRSEYFKHAQRVAW